MTTSILRPFGHHDQHQALTRTVDDHADAGRTIPCRQHPGTGSPWLSEDSRAQRAAAARCRPCPAREACAAYALAVGEPAGTWGGLTAHDRTTARQGRAAA